VACILSARKYPKVCGMNVTKSHLRICSETLVRRSFSACATRMRVSGTPFKRLSGRGLFMRSYKHFLFYVTCFHFVCIVVTANNLVGVHRIWSNLKSLFQRDLSHLTVQLRLPALNLFPGKTRTAKRRLTRCTRAIRRVWRAS